MRHHKIFLSCIFLLVAIHAKPQSVGDYSNMQSRFVKTELSAEDSAAFIKLGEQKAMQLFDRGSFYVSNSKVRNGSKNANQGYVQASIEDLFYVAEGEEINISQLIEDIAGVNRRRPESIALSTVKKAGLLGETRTTNCRPNMIFDLVLVRALKQFGEDEEMVWQVFLSNPRVE